jgi:hypothetical protein
MNLYRTDELKAILPSAAPGEARVLEYMIAHPGKTHAEYADALGISKGYVGNCVKRAKARAALRGGVALEADMVGRIAEGFRVKRVSTFYKIDPETGREVKNQWVIQVPDSGQIEEQWNTFVQWLIETIPAAAPTPAPAPPSELRSQRMAAYVIGDPHFGAYADEDETGESWTVEEAEKLAVHAAWTMVQSCPAATVGLIVWLGDILHVDDNSARTYQSGNKLDTDGRLHVMVQAALRAAFQMVDLALKVHDKVIVDFSRGNHDSNSAFFMSAILAAHYRNEPRVEVVTTSNPFHYHRWGCTLIGITHGDGPKPQDLPLLMAHDRPVDWGETTERVWLHGHVHHNASKEYMSVDVMSFGTLAASDAWHHSKGYRAKRRSAILVFDKEAGEILRLSFGLDRIRRGLKRA